MTIYYDKQGHRYTAHISEIANETNENLLKSSTVVAPNTLAFMIRNGSLMTHDQYIGYRAAKRITHGSKQKPPKT